jgi:glycosyltransferase involved in cell wall biosynthesis
MKIVIDGRFWGLENAGLGRYVINLVEEIAKYDSKNEYVILLRKKYFNKLKFPDNFKKVEAEFNHYGVAEQVRLPLLISSLKPDLVHFPHFNVPILYRGKFVVTIHDMLMHEQKGSEATTLQPALYAVKRVAYRAVFDHAVMYSKAIIVPTKAVKKAIGGFYRLSNNKTSVVYEGVESFKEVRLGERIPGPYFVFAGNAYPHKNLTRLIKAVKLLNKNYTQSKVKLIIVSARNVFFERLKYSVKKLRSEKYVELLGFVKDSKLFSIYKNAVAFVFPSVSEGFGLPGLEAMSAGTLLLASDIPVFKEVYGNNAVYFDPKNVNSIEKCMRMAINISPNDRKRMIASSLEFVKKYSWSKMAMETIKIYEKQEEKSGFGIR